MSRPLVVTLVLLLALAIAAAFVLRGSGDDDRDGAVPPSPVRPTDATGPDAREPADRGAATPDAGASTGPTRDSPDGGPPIDPKTGLPQPVIAAGSRIEGRVIDRGGAAQVGVEVRLVALEGAMVRIPRDLGISALTTEGGRFEFADLPGAVALEVSVSRDGFAHAEAPVGMLTAGKTISGIDLVLEPAITLRGTVTDTAGRPLPGAEVKVERSKIGGFAPRFDGVATADPAVFGGVVDLSATPTRTDGAGRYSVGGLSRTSYRVRVECPGHAPHVEEKSLLAVTLKPEARLDVKLSPTDGRASGSVRDTKGAPIAGATIEAEDDGATHKVETTSGGDGRFVLEGLAAREYRARASAPGRYSVGDTTLRPGDERVDLRVGSNGAAFGRAAFRGGGAPADLIVDLLRITDSGPSLIKRVPAQGAEFRADDLAPGGYVVELYAGGAARTRSHEFDVKDGGETDLGVVELARGGGVVVSLRAGKGSKAAVDGVPLALVAGDFAVANPSWQAHVLFGSAENRVISRGSKAHFEHVQPGVYSVFALPEHGAAGVVRGIVVTEGGTTDAGEIVLETGGSIEGRVLDVQGVGLAGFTVVARGDADAEAKSTSDAEGYFALQGLAAGEYRVTLAPDPKLRGTPREVAATVGDGSRVEVEVRVFP